MPNYDKLVLGKKARELGFVRDAFEKMARLTEFLQYINSEVELCPLLALKGGTSINLTVFNLPRLSVDIDLDFAENLTKNEIAAKRERIKELLGRYTANEGYTLSGKSKQTYALDSFVYSYRNAADNPDNIKVEINYMLRSHVLPVVDVPAISGGAFMSEHMTLTEKETAFLQQFTAGRYEPQLLFEDDEIVKRIENHPMALWRLQNIRIQRDKPR